MGSHTLLPLLILVSVLAFTPIYAWGPGQLHVKDIETDPTQTLEPNLPSN